MFVQFPFIIVLGGARDLTEGLVRARQSTAKPSCKLFFYFVLFFKFKNV